MPIGDLLGAGDLQSLPALDRLDVLRRLEQRFVRAGVEPRHAAAHHLARELAPREIRRLTSVISSSPRARRLERRRRCRARGCRRSRGRSPRSATSARCGFSSRLDRRARSRRTRRRRSARDRRPDTRRPSRPTCSRVARCELRLQVVAVEDVVAEHQRRRVAADEVAADDERLREAVRRRLHRVARCRCPSARRRRAAARSAACPRASRSAGCRGCRRASASTAGSRSSACRTPAAAASIRPASPDRAACPSRRRG